MRPIRNVGKLIRRGCTNVKQKRKQEEENGLFYRRVVEMIRWAVRTECECFRIGAPNDVITGGAVVQDDRAQKAMK